MTTGSSFVAYYRVSTSKQGASGLGVEAQRAAVAGYVSPGRIIEEFTEVESGKRSDRPELDRALASARLHRAPLVVAKVGRGATGENVMRYAATFLKAPSPRLQSALSRKNMRRLPIALSAGLALGSCGQRAISSLQALGRYWRKESPLCHFTTLFWLPRSTRSGRR